MLPLPSHDLDHIGIFVSDLDRSRAFYEQVLGMQLVERSEDADFWMLTLRSGDHEVHLFQPKSPGPAVTPRIDHLAYRIERRDLDAAMADLARRGIAYSGPHRYQDTSFIKFRDAAGLTWELICLDPRLGQSDEDADVEGCS
jgi:catechol 2,3-dioxygenase-like lactoylglutathione lyase family enzyme